MRARAAGPPNFGSVKSLASGLTISSFPANWSSADEKRLDFSIARLIEGPEELFDEHQALGFGPRSGHIDGRGIQGEAGQGVVVFAGGGQPPA